MQRQPGKQTLLQLQRGSKLLSFIILTSRRLVFHKAEGMSQKVEHYKFPAAFRPLIVCSTPEISNLVFIFNFLCKALLSV